jgi:hypothetical protein
VSLRKNLQLFLKRCAHFPKKNWKNFKVHAPLFARVLLLK